MAKNRTQPQADTAPQERPVAPEAVEAPPATRVPGEHGDVASDAPPPILTVMDEAVLPPHPPAGGAHPTEADRLRAENARLKEEMETKERLFERRLRDLEGRQAVPPQIAAAAAGQFPLASPARAKSTGEPAPDDPGRGDFLWSGTLRKGPNSRLDPLAPTVRFRTASASEAEAREAYRRFAGIVHTEHEVVVTPEHEGVSDR